MRLWAKAQRSGAVGNDACGCRVLLGSVVEALIPTLDLRVNP